MSLTRRIARPLLASSFIVLGWEAYNDAEPKAKAADPFLNRMRERVPLPEDNVTLVKAESAAMMAGGVLLAIGRFPRVAALVIAAALAPTTLAGHAFWDEQDPDRRRMQRIQFLKNLSMLGGLLLAAVDTGGRRAGEPAYAGRQT